ncbi:MAG: GNAT family N-acetyltransferase [Planctomycetes bacterium]|nr:GNAT family N-acetyltransferase [Planctomycetota bacterium]
MDGLRRLEAGIRYPLADGADHFRIDHGPRYHLFFSGMGHAQFVLALEGREVVGSLAGVLREARLGRRRIATAYLADLKVAPSHRGTRVAAAMALKALRAPLEDPRYRRWGLAWFAAMHGARGDVTRSARGLHPMRLLRPLARLAVYFVEARALASLGRLDGPAPAAGPWLDLSPAGAALVSTAGRKDLMLESTGRPWHLVHLAGAAVASRPSWCADLARAGEVLAERPAPPIACFALDARLRDHRSWLESRGLHPGATCTLYSLALTTLHRPHGWVHLATSEI